MSDNVLTIDNAKRYCIRTAGIAADAIIGAAFGDEHGCRVVNVDFVANGQHESMTVWIECGRLYGEW